MLLLGWSDQFDLTWVAPLSEDDIFRAFLISLFWLVLTSFSYFMPSLLFRRFSLNVPPVRVGVRALILFYGLVLISIATYIYTYKFYGGVVATLAGVRMGESILPTKFLYKIPNLIVIIFFLYYFTTHRQRFPKKWLLPGVLIVMTISLLWGDRSLSMLFFILFIFISVFESRGSKGAVLKASLYLFVIASLFVIFKVTRDLLFFGAEAGYNNNLVDNFVSGLNLQQYDYYAAYIRDFSPGHFDLQISYRGLTSIIPRMIWNTKPLLVTSGEILRAEYIPGSFSGWPVMPPAQWLLDGGWGLFLNAAIINGIIFFLLDVIVKDTFSYVVAIILFFFCFPAGFGTELLLELFPVIIVIVLAYIMSVRISGGFLTSYRASKYVHSRALPRAAIKSPGKT
jgi:oligosaccharide repeat unit polymerase